MAIELPDWFTDLVDAIANVNTEAITDPIVGLYTGIEVEGWTIPPFQCMICGDKFTGENAEKEYLTHLMSHIIAFQEGWFPEEEP